MVNKLSYSSVEKYLQCPKAWYMHYHRNLRERTVGSALFFGTAVDTGINVLLESKQNKPTPDDGYIFTTLIDAETKYLQLMTKQKINGVDVDLEKTSIIKYSNTDFDKDILTKEEDLMLRDVIKQTSLDAYHDSLVQMKREQRLTGEALKHFNLMSWVSLRRKGLMFIDAYQAQVIPNIEEVLDVQKFFSIKNEDGDEFLGFIDYICRYKNVPGIVVKDNKTSASAYKPSQARESKQLASYVGVLSEKGYTKEPMSVGFNVMNKVIRKKKEPRVNIQVIIDQVDEELIDSVFSAYDMVNQQIHDGFFPSRHPECSKNNYGSPCLCQVPKDQLVDISHLKEKK